MTTVNTDPITELVIPQFETAVLVLAMTLYGILVVSGVFFVTIFVLVLIKGQVTFREIPFFMIVYQLTFCNLLGIYIQAFCKFPLLFYDTSDNTTWQYWWEVIGTRIVYFSDTGFTLFVLLMALNRFAFFVFPKLLRFFTKKIVWYPIGVTWILIGFITFVKIMWGSIDKFDRKNWSITHLLVNTDANILMTLVSWLDYIISFLLLGIYASIYVMVRKKRTAHGMEDKDDSSLLTQAVLVSLSLMVFRMLANVSGSLNTSTWLSWTLNILRFSASVTNNMLNPSQFKRPIN